MKDKDQMEDRDNVDLTNIDLANVHKDPDDEEFDSPDDELLYDEESALVQAMASEDRQNAEGTFLTGGNMRAESIILLEREYDRREIFEVKKVTTEGLREFLRANLYRFESPYSYLGGEANSMPLAVAELAEVRVLICRLSTYEATSLSMSHHLLLQFLKEQDGVYGDYAFLPKPGDYQILTEEGFPVWFGENTKKGPTWFDVLFISHPVSMEQLNVIPLMRDSGIPLWKTQRMDDESVPLILLGGANSGTTAPLWGGVTDEKGVFHHSLLDGVIYGEGEEAVPLIITLLQEGKRKGLTKREILRSFHGVVPGFYEGDLYEHTYDGAGSIIEVKPLVEYVEREVRRATPKNLDSFRTMEEKVLPFIGEGATVDVSLTGSAGCIGCFTADTRVLVCEDGSDKLTEKGFLKISVSDLIMTPSGTLRKWNTLYKNGMQEVHRFFFSNGFRLDGTKSHVVPVKKFGKTSWEEDVLGGLKPGDRVNYVTHEGTKISKTEVMFTHSVPLGLAETFDLEVDQEHYYFANGFEVHNSAGLGSCSFCFDSSFYVHTQLGMLTFGEMESLLSVRDQVTSVDLDILTDKTIGKATKFFKNPPEKLLELKLVNGGSIRATPNHKFGVMTLPRYADQDPILVMKPLGDIDPEQDILFSFFDGSAAFPQDYYDCGKEADEAVWESQGGVQTMDYTLPRRFTEKWALWLGLLIGDGCITERWRIEKGTRVLVNHMDLFFSEREKVMWPAIKELYEDLFGPVKRNDVPFSYEERTRGVCKVDFSSKRVRIFLEQLGLGRWDSFNKEVPMVIRRSPESVVCAFLSGLFSTDGSVLGGRQPIYFGTTSKVLAEQVAGLLYGLGILCKCYEYENGFQEDLALSFYKDRERTRTYKVFITSSHAKRLFHEKIKLFYTNKRDTLEEYISLLDDGVEERLPYRFKKNSLGLWAGQKDFLTAVWQKHRIVTWAVESIKEVPGLHHTYCLEVPEGHRFTGVSGRLFVQNCREGSEAPYRERSLTKVLDALEKAVKNQGSKEVSFFCFAGDNNVLTDRGLVRFDEVQDASKIQDQEGLQTFASFEEREIQEVRVIELADGSILKVTPDHKVEVLSYDFPFHKFKPARDITSDDYVLTQMGGLQSRFSNPPEPDENFYKLGLVSGLLTELKGGRFEGRISISSSYETLDIVMHFMPDSVVMIEEGVATIMIDSKVIRELTGSPDEVSFLVRVPKIVREMAKGVCRGEVISYLSGVLETTVQFISDGKKKVMEFHLTGEIRVREIQALFRLMGVAVIIRRDDKSATFLNDPWILRVEDKESLLILDAMSLLRVAGKRMVLKEMAQSSKCPGFTIPGVIALRMMKGVREELVTIKDCEEALFWMEDSPEVPVPDLVLMKMVDEYVTKYGNGTSSKEFSALYAMLNTWVVPRKVRKVRSGGLNKTYDVVDMPTGRLVVSGVVCSNSLNFNQYTDLFPLVSESIKRGYKVGLISQRVDMLAETPEQIEMQKFLGKMNYTLGIEGISERMRAYLNKNLREEEILKVIYHMMMEGATELKLFYISCLGPEVRVITSGGYRKIGDLVGDIAGGNEYGVFSSDPTTLWDGRKLVEVREWSKKEEPLLRVITTAGMEMEVAENHLFFDGKGWVYAKDLMEGSQLEVAVGSGGVFPNYVKLPEFQKVHGLERDVGVPEYLDENLGELLGFLIGDGGLYYGEIEGGKETRGIYLTANGYDKNEIDYVSNLLKKQGSGWVPFTEQHSGNLYRATIGSKVLGRLMDYLGMHGETSINWKVPELIFCSPESVRAAFVRGYFIADGSCQLNKGRYRPRFGSVSKDLTLGLQELLLTLGVFGTITRDESSRREWTGNAYYQLVIRAKYLTRFKEVLEGDFLVSKVEKVSPTGYFSPGRVEKTKVRRVERMGVGAVYSPIIRNSEHAYYAGGLIHHNTGYEKSEDMDEWGRFAETVNAMREELGAKTRFRISFTPLFPSAQTALQFAPAMAALQHGSRSLNPVFFKAKELGWGRRLSVSGEEPLVSNTINHGGRNIINLLLDSYFADGFRFYGTVPKGTWARWKARIDRDPNISLPVMWGAKDFTYIFPWDDIKYSSSKSTLWYGYLNARHKEPLAYCLTTPTQKGTCHSGSLCSTCAVGEGGKPVKEIIQAIVNRKVAPAINADELAQIAQSRAKQFTLRVKLWVVDPMLRYADWQYFYYYIPRALMQVSDTFLDCFSGPSGHARISAGAHDTRDWTFGVNFYDFAMSKLMREQELRDLIPAANKLLEGCLIEDLRLDSELRNLRNTINQCIYTIYVPATVLSFANLRKTVAAYFERAMVGKKTKIKIKVVAGKDVFRTEQVNLKEGQVRQAEVKFVPELRGSILRMVVGSSNNVYAILEAITGIRSFRWKAALIYVDDYVSVPEVTGDVDIFNVLKGRNTICPSCGGPLEQSIMTGDPVHDICLSCDMSQYQLNLGVFKTSLRGLD